MFRDLWRLDWVCSSQLYYACGSLSIQTDRSATTSDVLEFIFIVYFLIPFHRLFSHPFSLFIFSSLFIRSCRTFRLRPIKNHSFLITNIYIVIFYHRMSYNFLWKIISLISEHDIILKDTCPGQKQGSFIKLYSLANYYCYFFLEQIKKNISILFQSVGPTLGTNVEFLVLRTLMLGFEWRGIPNMVLFIQTHTNSYRLYVQNWTYSMKTHDIVTFDIN